MHRLHVVRRETETAPVKRTRAPGRRAPAVAILADGKQASRHIVAVARSRRYLAIAQEDAAENWAGNQPQGPTASGSAANEFATDGLRIFCGTEPEIAPELRPRISHRQRIAESADRTDNTFSASRVSIEPAWTLPKRKNVLDEEPWSLSFRVIGRSLSVRKDKVS